MKVFGFDKRSSLMKKALIYAIKSFTKSGGFLKSIPIRFKNRHSKRKKSHDAIGREMQSMCHFPEWKRRFGKK